MCSLNIFCNSLLKTWPLKENVVSGVTKLSVIFDEKSNKIAIVAIRATKLHLFAMTSFIERTPKDEVSRLKIRNTTIDWTECPKVSG